MKITSCIILFLLILSICTGNILAAEEKPWKQELSLGYSQKTGNTRSEELTTNYEGQRITEEAELTLKASTLYSAQNKKMDGQKHTGSVRYAPNLGDSKWFGFGKFEAEHDRFAGIDYRYLPSVGAGYWFSHQEEWKSSAEVGVGQEHVKYTDGSDDDNVVLIPRFFFEKAMFEKASLSEELILYPSLEDIKKYRIRSETRFTNPLSDDLAMRVSFIDEFNTNPLGDAKKNDTQLLLSLVYAF